MSFVRTTVKTRFDPLPYNNQSKRKRRFRKERGDSELAPRPNIGADIPW